MVWKRSREKEITPRELAQIMSDPLFRKIEYVGVSGGEPTLRQDLNELFSVIAEKKGINGVGLITNGLEAKNVISNILRCNEVCISANIPFNVMVSLDGIGKVHDTVRGRRKAYENALKVIYFLRDNTNIALSLGCTVIKQNVWYLDEVLDFCKREKIYGRFRIGEYINRLYNDDMKKTIRNFTVDERYQIALFFTKLELYYENSPEIKQTYRNIRQMIFGNRFRESGCPYRSEAVGLDSKGNLIFCSPKSPILGSCLKKSAKRISEESNAIRETIIKKFCHYCVHDYHSLPSNEYIAESAQEIFYAKKMAVIESINRSKNLSSAVYENLDISELKNILIIGWYGTETAGDKAILSAIISKYKEKNPKVKISIASLYPFITERTLDELNEKEICILKTYSDEYLKACQFTDAVIMGGGPLMGMEPLGFVLTAFSEARNANKLCIIEGCGIGPLVKEEHIQAVKEILRLSTQIKVRDKNSLSWVIKNTGRFDAKYTNDPAVNFVNHYKNNICNQKIVHYEGYFACFLREITVEYANGKEILDFMGFRERFEGELGRLINFIKEKTGLKPLFMPMHTFAVGQDDRDFARRFAEKFLKIGEYKIGNEVYSPQDILSVMNSSKLNVCMRFHSVLFAEQLNVPFVAIDYTGGGKVKSYLNDHNRMELMFKREDIENRKWKTRINNILLNLNLKKLEIIHLCSNDDGGAGKAALRLNKNLKEIGGKSTLLVLNKKSKDSSVKIIPSEYSGVLQNCSNEQIYNSKSWFLHAQRWQSELNKYPKRPKGLEIFTDEISDVQLNKITDICDADIVNLHWVAGALDYLNAPLSLRDKPIVWTLHDMNPFTGGCHYSGSCEKYIDMCGACPQLGSKKEEDLSRRIWKIKNYAYQNLDIHVVTPSKWLAGCVSKSSLMSKFPIDVIPNGIPVKIYKPTSKQEIRNGLNIDKSANVILFGADNLKNNRKGYVYLIEALKYYKPKENVDTVLLTFGNFTGNDENKTKLPIYNLGSISNEIDIAKIYNAADVFVISSLEDNLPNTAIEAMACGVPVVGFKVGGMSDIIDHFITGYLAKPKDVKDLIIGIEWVLAQKNTDEKIKKQCREKAEKCYSTGLQTYNYNNLYLEHAKIINKKQENETKIEIESEKKYVKNNNNKEKYYKTLRKYLGKGHNHKAIETLEKLIEKYPECAVANNDLAVLYYNVGKKKQALQHYLTAVKYAPENNLFKKNLAEFHYIEFGQVEKALQIYVEVLESDPEDVEVILAIGRISIDLNQLEDAKILLTKAINIDCDNENVRKAIIKLGDAYHREDNKISEKELYLAYLNKMPEDRTITKAWAKTKDTEKDKKIIEIIKSKSREYLVSAIISTYNSEEFIAECLDNLISQTIADKIEIVVIDAGSKQNEGLIVKSYLKRKQNITYIRTKTLIGVYSAWNIAIKHSRAPYCISVSTNDHLRKETIEILANYLDKHPDYALIYGDTYLTQKPHETFENNTHFDTYKWKEFSYDELLKRCMIGPHPMWRKSIHYDIGYFDERYYADGDQEFWLRIGEKYKIFHINEFTGLQWINNDAISRKGELPDLEVKYLHAFYKRRYEQKINKNETICSIIIPVYNKVELTLNCLNSLNKNIDLVNNEIIIVDNGSTEKTGLLIKKKHPNIKIINNNINLGFSKACNQGAKAANGKYLIFLNNDTEVSGNWLEPLLRIANNDNNVAAVGSKLLFPDRTIQHAGVIIINDKILPDPLVARHIYYKLNEDLPEANKLFYYQALTAACLMVRKKYFHNVGGFDEQYWNGYEDVDLCFKLQEKGWRLVYQPESVALHHESKSGDERFKKTKENIDLLHKKWIRKITPDIIIAQDGNIKATNANHIKEYTFQNEKLAIDQKQDQSAKVSIIILTLNQVEYTRKCIESIFKHTHVSFEVIVVDNGSSDETLEYLNSLKEKNCKHQKITIISNNKNLGFAGGNNLGLGVSRGNYLLLMNNDIVVTPGWLERLINCAERSPKIGIVGPMSNNVSGPQVIRNIEYNTETLEGLETFSEKLAEENALKSHQILRVVGFCMLIKRKVICKIGGMDQRFGLGNFEDDDFSLRAALAGFESWMVEDCFVHHYGSRTFIGEKIDHAKSLHKNWEIFKEKWGLPSGLPYGSPYSLSQMKINEFDPKIHYISISANDYNSFQNCPKNIATVDQEYRVVYSNIEKVDLKVAIEKLKGFAKRYVDYALVYNDMGVLFFQKGDNESALKNYQKAVKLNPQNINFKKNLADLLSVTFGELEEALQHYVAVLASDPKDVEALSATGHICARLERYDDAAEFYEKVLETEPHNSDVQNWLAKMREKSPANFLGFDLNSCYLTLLSEIAQEDLAGAITKIENFIEMYPTHGQAHNDLGVLFYKNEYKTKVLAHYLKAVELEPENVTYRKNLADFLYVEEDRVEEALENYVEVLRIKPDDVETLLITGHICTAIERFEDAMSFYHKVLNLEPQNLDARQNMEALEKRQISMLNQEVECEKNPGDKTEINQAEPHDSNDDVPIIQTLVVEDFIKKADLLFQQERIDQAVDIFLKAIAVNPLDGSTYIELAWQLINHNRHESALEVLSEMPVNQPEVLAKQKLLLEGYGQEGMGNYAVAKKCCDSILAREPKNSKALNLNGILAYRNGGKETAEQHFKHAIELDSKYGEPHTNLGALVWETSEQKIALEHYERGFSISPTDIDVANAYHEAVSATGEYKRAEKVARGALKKYPQCRKVLYLLIDTLIRQEKTEEALKELETALSTFGIDEGLLDTALALRERVWKIKKTGSAKNPGVSLCMIVKDEEANLARCLASVKPIVGEMVVVDTGSTDRTRDIAEFFGARVYEFEWGGDFAEARNFSLSKAKGDWIFIMDADEIISPQDYKRFRKLTAKKPSELRAYSIITRNYSNMANTIGWIPNTGQYKSEESGLGWLSSEKVRLFSNNSEIKFEGAVHEMVDPVLKRQSIRIKKCPIPVHHYGRLNTGKLTRKDQTYFEIGRNKLLRNGGDIGAVRELAVQATVLEKNSEAIELWQKFLSMGPGKPEVSDAYVNMVSAYIRMQDYDNALKLAQKAVSISPQMKEAQYNLGIAELYNGNPGTAFKTFNKLAQRHPDFTPAQFLLAASNYCRKNTADMNGNIKKLKQSAFGPALTYSVAELAEGLMTANHHKLAFKLLQNAIKDEIISKSIFGLYTDCLEKIKEPNKESDMIFEKDDTLSESISECNLK